MPDDNVFHVTSHNQQGGITAGQVNIGPQPRQLNEQGQTQILKNIPKDKKVTVTSVLGDGEAFQFASQIKAFLEQAGYDVTGVDQAVYTTPMNGQNIVTSDDGTNLIIGTRL